MCYTPTRADPAIYLWAAVKPDGFEYYKMVLCYVDDILGGFKGEEGVVH
jgi:hypothetical protein